MTRDGDIAVVAVRQHGLLTHAQALAAGISDRMIAVRLGSGRWVRFRRGVYAIAGTPPSERQAVLAACLATGTVASHLTAGRLWGMELPTPASIEVVGRRIRLEGIRAHDSGTIVAGDRVELGAIPLTSPARTLVDCANRVPPHRLGAVVDDALRRRLVTLAALRACQERVDTGPGRRPTIAMREVLAERAGDYDCGDSPPEVDLVRLLAARGLPAPVLGHRVRVGRHRYRIDVAWPEVLLGLEYDGWDAHRTFTAFHGDRQRLRRIVASGWTILPVTAKTDLDELVTDVEALIWRASTA